MSLYLIRFLSRFEQAFLKKKRGIPQKRYSSKKIILLKISFLTVSERSDFERKAIFFANSKERKKGIRGLFIHLRRAGVFP
jgi:hypothetical protein